MVKTTPKHFHDVYVQMGPDQKKPIMIYLGIIDVKLKVKR